MEKTRESEKTNINPSFHATEPEIIEFKGKNFALKPLSTQKTPKLCRIFEFKIETQNANQKKRVETLIAKKYTNKKSGQSHPSPPNQKFLTEKFFLNILKHENILELKQAIIKPSGVQYLIFPKYDTTLLKLTKDDQTPIPHIQKERLFIGVFQAVKAIHKKKIVHGDLKPGNVLFCPKNFRPLICDFDCSIMAQECQGKKWEGGFTFKYAAPEVISGSEITRPFAIDIWGLGLLWFDIFLPLNIFSNYALKKFKPNDKRNKLEVIKKGFDWKKIQQNFRTFNEQFKNPIETAESFSDLIQKMLFFDPGRRITLEEIEEHPFYKLLSGKFW